MTDKKLYGIVPALITPLNEDLSLDIDHLEKLLEHQIAGGVHGIFAAGFTGEGAALTASMLEELTRQCARIIANRVPLCVGVLETGGKRTVETAKRLEDCGADFLSTTVPYAPPIPSQDDIVRHFEYVCGNTSLPWMVYGNSGCLTNIEPNTFRRLSQIDGISAIKDTRPDFEGHLKNLMAVRGTDVTILCGGEYLVGPGLLFGADGNISGATNLFPKLFARIYADAKQGNVAAVHESAEKIALLHGITAKPGACWLSAFKYAGSRLGLMKPYCLNPSNPLTREQEYEVDGVLEMLRV